MKLNKIHFCKVDIEAEPETAKFFNVYHVPTVVMIKEGEVIDLIRGFLPASKMRKTISKIFVD